MNEIPAMQSTETDPEIAKAFPLGNVPRPMSDQPEVKPMLDAPIETHMEPMSDQPTVSHDEVAKEPEPAPKPDPVHEKLASMHEYFTAEVAAIRTEAATTMNTLRAEFKAEIARLHTVI